MPTLCHQNYCRMSTKHIENNQNIIYVKQSRQETRWTIKYINISSILWLMRNYLTAQYLKYTNNDWHCSQLSDILVSPALSHNAYVKYFFFLIC